MSDYQAIYDAVRSRIPNCNPNEMLRDVFFQQFAVSHILDVIKKDLCCTIENIRTANLRPSVVFKPLISIDGNQWCALLGENLQDGIAGFGKTAELAMQDFDDKFVNMTVRGG